ncbi:outer membrane beta-barrel protein [Aureimonas sp. AU12]|uniref:outer membrane beta-barrel protein n=1 Tax=Aureimonas sp. AU12 TaxID=1638161 RepID=UPI00078169BF|nr:outer membrane beta-barrel protein [Aureimonas sp. AU12]
MLGDDARFSDGFQLRTGTDAIGTDAPTSDRGVPGDGNGRLVEPLGRSGNDNSRSLGQDLGNAPLRAPGERSADAPSADGIVEVPPVDLLAGPAISRRENLPDEPAAADAPQAATRAPRIGAVPTADDPAAGPSEAADLFRSIGPVRSPAFDDVGGRRLNTGLDALRRSLPSSADDPFAPVGVRVGRFVVTPTIEQSLGVSDNLTNSRDGVRGAFSQTTLSARAVSDWSRHEAEINAAAAYRRNFEGPVREEPQIDLDGRLRLDLSRELTATLRGALAFSRDDGILTGESQIAADQSDVLAYSVSGELARDIGRFNAAMTLEAVREDREDGVFDGGTLSPGDSFSTYTAGLRGGYDLDAPLSPFVSLSAGRRVFDDAGALGVSRDSVIPAAKAGLGLNFGEKLRGEVALGYAWNVPDEDAFKTTGSPTLDAALTWSPRRGTDVLLKAATFFEPDASGTDTATLYQGTLGLRHRATARLDLETQLIAALRDREVGERERVYSAEAGFTYWLNRQLALLGRYRYDRFDTLGSIGDYAANTLRFGVRLQR